jgi:hypothetical protein
VQKSENLRAQKFLKNKETLDYCYAKYKGNNYIKFTINPEVLTMEPKNKNNFLTNGETFGTEISLGRNDSADNWREVTPEEKAEIEKQQQAEVMI